jgi:cell division protein FtsQ
VRPGEPVRPGEASSSPSPRGAADVAFDPDDTADLTDAISSRREPDASWRSVWRATRARRKVLRAEVRRFTGRSRRRRLLWTIGVGSVLLLVAGSAAAAYSPLFAVTTITVAGAEELDAEAVEQALSDQLDRPLPLVDHGEVKAALIAFPLIETYSLEARPPHDLVVRVVERTPVGVLESDAGFTTVDAAGVALTTTEQAPEGLPLIAVEGGTDSDAFHAAGQVLRSLPGWLREQVGEVTATTADDITLVLGDGGPQVLWGSEEESGMKARTLESAMAATMSEEDITSYDVSAPDNLVVTH